MKLSLFPLKLTFSTRPDEHCCAGGDRTKGSALSAFNFSVTFCRKTCQIEIHKYKYLLLTFVQFNFTVRTAWVERGFWNWDVWTITEGRVRLSSMGGMTSGASSAEIVIVWTLGTFQFSGNWIKSWNSCPLMSISEGNPICRVFWRGGCNGNPRIAPISSSPVTHSDNQD